MRKWRELERRTKKRKEIGLVRLLCRELRSAEVARAEKAYKKGNIDWISTLFAQGIKKCGSGKSWEGVLKREKRLD